MNEDNLIKLLDADGLLSKKLPLFEERTSQKQMLQDVLAAYLEERASLIEAGTGVGKSMAYLLPAIFWAIAKKEPTIISTHTLALQDQLVKKDIPSLLKVLDTELKVVVAKGMNNYICLRKLDDSAATSHFLSDVEREDLDKIQHFLPQACEGTRTELPFQPSVETWERVGAENENCTYQRCPHFKECFFFQARSEAGRAALVVTNHHLLFADLSVRFEKDNYTDPCLLPAYKRVILDEAHRVEDIARSYLSKKVGSQFFFRLLNKLTSEKKGGKLKMLQQKVFEVYGEQKEEKARLWHQLEIEFPLFRKTLMDEVHHLFQGFAALLYEYDQKEKLRIRASVKTRPLWCDLQNKVKEVIECGKKGVYAIFGFLKEVERDDVLSKRVESLVAEVRGIVNSIDEGLARLHEFTFGEDEGSHVRWIEVNGSHIELIVAPLDISRTLKEALFEKTPTVVLCSATLAINHSFSFTKARLGIEKACEAIYPSPFAYERKSMLLVPLDMPDPDKSEFQKSVEEKIRTVARITQGGTLYLFTSFSMLKSVKEAVIRDLEQEDFVLLCQGDDSPMALIGKFRVTKKAILFGIDSFWEGIDIVGEALRCVVIVKLPFLVPSDPFFEAKSEQLIAEKKSPFLDYSVPHAAMKFKQGFGRLIRSAQDRGCVICLDRRIAKKGYGKVFLNALPPAPCYFEESASLFERMKRFYNVSD